MLLADHKDPMLPTVISRCSCYQLADSAYAEDPQLAMAADMMLELVVKGSPFYRKKAVLAPVLGEKEGQREKALAFLEAFETRLLAALKNGPDEKLLAAEDRLREARRALRQLHNAGYTLKELCLRI